jgi:hypothetical protein
MTARGFRPPEGLGVEFVEFEPVVGTVTIAWLAVHIAPASADELRTEVRPLVDHLIGTIRATAARRWALVMTEYIELRGARENNLRDVTLRILKRQITVFTGVSGSGKSSIVFDTIATEAQRQLYKNFSYFIRSFLPRYPQPDADAIVNLSNGRIAIPPAAIGPVRGASRAPRRRASSRSCGCSAGRPRTW